MSPPSVDRHLLKRQTFMDVAGTIAVLGTCERKKVGAVIVRDGRCVSWGFNGAPPGLSHCADNHHGWDYGPGQDILNPEEAALEFGCKNATHAEANALAFAARQGISTDNSILFVTLSPCETCSRLLIAAGVREVFYKEEYRDRAGVKLLERAGVLCERW
jgi:dCMP deaminase